MIRFIIKIRLRLLESQSGLIQKNYSLGKIDRKEWWNESCKINAKINALTNKLNAMR